MVIGSHNSWSYLKPLKWWMRPFAFMARCQREDIETQYDVCMTRCFDLRVRFDESGKMMLAHGLMVYDMTELQLMKELYYINSRGYCWVRVLNEVRTVKQHTYQERMYFQQFCRRIETRFRNIKFWCGRNLADWMVDYSFVTDQNPEPSCEEKYASVCPPKWIDDWWPWLFAHRNNTRIVDEGTDKDILLIDFVNIQ